MAAHGVRGGDERSVGFPDVVPFDLPYLSRLSWELGSRVVDDDEATLRGEWEYEGGPWSLAVFRVTNNTAVVRVRTPTGRQRFYGAGQEELESTLPTLRDAPDWRRRP